MWIGGCAVVLAAIIRDHVVRGNTSIP